VARLCTGIYTELHMQCGGYLGMQPYSLNLHHPCYRKKSDAHSPLSSSHLVSSRYVNVGGFFSSGGAAGLGRGLPRDLQLYFSRYHFLTRRQFNVQDCTYCL
jgi:hypothetical protein